MIYNHTIFIGGDEDEHDDNDNDNDDDERGR